MSRTATPKTSDERAPVRPGIPADSRGAPPSHRPAWRTPVVLLMIVSLVVTGLMQRLAQVRRRELVTATPAASTASASLSNLNSFSLALLLGGLRGPLVMILWTSSESQKQEKDLEDFDTKIELIRLLQPEFDSVHLFQIWNKAYNISVQMASLANKYATILDAVDYAQKINRQRPNDINIVASLGQVWFDKLGSSQEKEYYTQRVMEETKWRPPDRVKKSDPGWRRYRLDPLLDAAGNILPEFLVPHPSDPPISPSTDGEVNDGSDLQYIRQFQPFPYGVPPMAVGYNYYKQAQVLMATTHQKHLQLSDLVIDNRPAVTLKLWAEAEWLRGSRLEMEALGKTPPPAGTMGERAAVALATASLADAGSIKDRSVLPEALYCYNLTVRVARRSILEYERHLRHFGNNLGLYRSHKDGLRALEALAQGDYDSLRLVAGDAKDPSDVKADAIASYNRAAGAYASLVLRYYTDEDTLRHVFPPGLTRTALDDTVLPEDQLRGLLKRADEYIRVNRPGEANSDDRKEDEDCLNHAETRIAELQANRR